MLGCENSSYRRARAARFLRTPGNHRRRNSSLNRLMCFEPLEVRAMLSVSTAQDLLLSSLSAFQAGDKGDAGNPVAKVGYDLASIYASYNAPQTQEVTYSH